MGEASAATPGLEDGGQGARPVGGPQVPPRFASIAAAEQELARATQLTRKVLDNVGDGIYGLDAQGRVEFVNAATTRLTGYQAEELLGLNAHAVLHSRFPDGTPYPVEQCLTFRALRTGRPSIAHDEVFWRKDGRPLPVNVVAVPTLDDAGEVTGLVVSFRDTTSLAAALEQATQLREAVTREAGQRALTDRLQQALLTPPPEPDQLHVVVRYLPAAEFAQVGGDWYDALVQPDGATMLVIGDVMGHDGAAAARMGQLRGVLRALAYDHGQDTPAQILTRVERVTRGLAVDALATAVLARIEAVPLPAHAGHRSRGNPGTRQLRWSNAGHPPPVLLLSDGSSAVLARDADLLLGVDPYTARQDHTVALPDNSTLLMFTDGLIERRGASLDDGLLKLQEALTHLAQRPLNELCDALVQHMGCDEADDDIALIAVRCYPEDRPRPISAGRPHVPLDIV